MTTPGTWTDHVRQVLGGSTHDPLYLFACFMNGYFDIYEVDAVPSGRALRALRADDAALRECVEAFRKCLL